MLEIWEVVSTAPNNVHVGDNTCDDSVVKVFTEHGKPWHVPQAPGRVNTVPKI